MRDYFKLLISIGFTALLVAPVGATANDLPPLPVKKPQDIPQKDADLLPGQTRYRLQTSVSQDAYVNQLFTFFDYLESENKRVDFSRKRVDRIFLRVKAVGEDAVFEFIGSDGTVFAARKIQAVAADSKQASPDLADGYQSVEFENGQGHDVYAIRIKGKVFVNNFVTVMNRGNESRQFADAINRPDPKLKNVGSGSGGQSEDGVTPWPDDVPARRAYVTGYDYAFPGKKTEVVRIGQNVTKIGLRAKGGRVALLRIAYKVRGRWYASRSKPQWLPTKGVLEIENLKGATEIKITARTYDFEFGGISMHLYYWRTKGGQR